LPPDEGVKCSGNGQWNEKKEMMNTVIDCIPCFARQAAEALSYCVTEEARRAEIMRRLLADLSACNWNAAPPIVAQRLNKRIREESGEPDPYKDLKARMNSMAREMLPCLRQAAHLEEDPHMAIVRVAIAGNLIDAGAKTQLGEAETRNAICRICQEGVNGPVSDLFAAARDARQILYLADNAGEIVFDRILIEALPAEKMYVAVRGAPVINDATMEDAAAAGLPDIVRVISNGSDAPGTDIKDCSKEFRDIYEASDLIIAKGQGNYETLHAADKNIFFLLLVKCNRVAMDIGAPVGSLVVKRGAKRV
jgi:damage-control phosphatase, subfamily I